MVLVSAKFNDGWCKGIRLRGYKVWLALFLNKLCIARKRPGTKLSWENCPHFFSTPRNVNIPRVEPSRPPVKYYESIAIGDVCILPCASSHLHKTSNISLSPPNLVATRAQQDARNSLYKACWRIMHVAAHLSSNEPRRHSE